MSEKEPFTVYAAEVSLWAPIMTVMANIAARMMNPPRETEVIVGYISIAVLVAGLVLGIVGLFGPKRKDWRDTFFRSMVGVGLNAVLLVAIFALLPISSLAGDAAQKHPEVSVRQAACDPFTFRATAEAMPQRKGG